MNSLLKHTAALGVILFLILATALAIVSYTQKSFGSVMPGGEYVATTTDATWSAAVTQCKPLLTQNKTLGSVIITKTSNATLNIYDATSTMHSDHATTTIASFPLTTVGEYTFDVTASRGLCFVVDTTVGVASTTITTRP